MAQNLPSLLASLLKDAIRRSGRVIPVPVRYKQRLQSYLFQTAPRLFSRFESYSEWKRDYAPIDYSALVPHADKQESDGVENNHISADSSRRILVVTHNAKPHGAQFLALGMVKMLKQDMNLNVEVVLLGGGRLRTEFGKLTPVYQFNEFCLANKELKLLARALVRRGFRKAIVNTAASGKIVPIFRDAGIESICLIHELPGVIRRFSLEKQARQIAENANALVFPAKIVADGFSQFAKVDAAKQFIRPQGLYRRNGWRTTKDAARTELRRRLSLEGNAKIVLTVGFADHRKGVDLFVDCAIKVMSSFEGVHFVWVGHWDEEMHRQNERRLGETPFGRRVHFVGYDPDTSLYHAGSDVYALTSREDPFPNVVLESFDVAVPVVAFSGTGGAAHLVGDVGGITVPLQDVDKFAEAISRLLETPELSLAMGRSAQKHVDTHFSFREYMSDLCALAGINA